jgi:hypothetical protein
MELNENEGPMKYRKLVQRYQNQGLRRNWDEPERNLITVRVVAGIKVTGT